MDWTTGVRFPEGVKILFAPIAYEPNVGPYQLPIQRMKNFFPSGHCGLVLKLIVTLHIAFRSRMVELYTTPPMFRYSCVYIIKHGGNFTFYIISSAGLEPSPLSGGHIWPILPSLDDCVAIRGMNKWHGTSKYSETACSVAA